MMSWLDLQDQVSNSELTRVRRQLRGSDLSPWIHQLQTHQLPGGFADAIQWHIACALQLCITVDRAPVGLQLIRPLPNLSRNESLLLLGNLAGLLEAVLRELAIQAGVGDAQYTLHQTLKALDSKQILPLSDAGRARWDRDWKASGKQARKLSRGRPDAASVRQQIHSDLVTRWLVRLSDTSVAPLPGYRALVELSLLRNHAAHQRLESLPDLGPHQAVHTRLLAFTALIAARAVTAGVLQAPRGEVVASVEAVASVEMELDEEVPSRAPSFLGKAAVAAAALVLSGGVGLLSLRPSVLSSPPPDPVAMVATPTPAPPAPLAPAFEATPDATPTPEPTWCELAAKRPTRAKLPDVIVTQASRGAPAAAGSTFPGATLTSMLNTTRWGAQTVVVRARRAAEAEALAQHALRQICMSRVVEEAPPVLPPGDETLYFLDALKGSPKLPGESYNPSAEDTATPTSRPRLLVATTSFEPLDVRDALIIEPRPLSCEEADVQLTQRLKPLERTSEPLMRRWGLIATTAGPDARSCRLAPALRSHDDLDLIASAIRSHKDGPPTAHDGRWTNWVRLAGAPRGRIRAHQQQATQVARQASRCEAWAQRPNPLAPVELIPYLLGDPTVAACGPQLIAAYHAAGVPDLQLADLVARGLGHGPYRDQQIRSWRAAMGPHQTRSPGPIRRAGLRPVRVRPAPPPADPWLAAFIEGLR